MNTKALLDHVAQRDTHAEASLRGWTNTARNTRSIRRFAGPLHRSSLPRNEGFRYLKEIWGPTPAQKRYEGRADLGNVRDGRRAALLRPGIFQLTGRANYARIGAALVPPA
jgi:predicted chitinase